MTRRVTFLKSNRTNCDHLTSLHLLSLERHERLLGVVEVDELRPLGRVVEEGVVLLREGLAYGLVLRIQGHLGLLWVVGSGEERRKEEEEETKKKVHELIRIEYFI